MKLQDIEPNDFIVDAINKEFLNNYLYWLKSNYNMITLP